MCYFFQKWHTFCIKVISGSFTLLCQPSVFRVVLHKPSNDALKVPAVHLLPIVFETWHTPGETLSKAPPDSRAKAGFLTLPLLFDNKEEKIVLFPSLWLKNLF